MENHLRPRRPQVIIDDIRHARAVIRHHRDQRGDDRCWLDDYAVWALVKGSFLMPTALPDWESGMDICRAFYKFRRSEAADPVPVDAIINPADWDNVLAGMDATQLQEMLETLQNAVRAHRDAACNGLTIDDDRRLYAVLPEKIPADFRLPKVEDFLGEGRAPVAGCPSFWHSHAACGVKSHDLSVWGPCKGIAR